MLNRAAVCCPLVLICKALALLCYVLPTEVSAPAPCNPLAGRAEHLCPSLVLRSPTKARPNSCVQENVARQTRCAQASQQRPANVGPSRAVLEVHAFPGSHEPAPHVRSALLAHNRVLQAAHESPVADVEGASRGDRTHHPSRVGDASDEVMLHPLRLKGGYVPGRGQDPEAASKRQAMLQALRESAQEEQERTPGYNAIDELLRQRAATNLPDGMPFNFTWDEGGELAGKETWEQGSSFEEEQNIFVRVPSIIDPVYDEEYADMREEAVAKGETPPPVKVYRTAYWTEAVSC